MSFPSVLSTGSVKISSCSLDKTAPFSHLSQDCVFQSKYPRVLNKGDLYPSKVYFFCWRKEWSHDLQATPSFCLVRRLWQSLTFQKLSGRDSHEMMCKYSKTGLHWVILWRPIFKVLLKGVWQQMILQACWIAIASTLLSWAIMSHYFLD